MLFNLDTLTAYGNAAVRLQSDVDSYKTATGTDPWSAHFEKCFDSKYCDTMFPRYLKMMQSRALDLAQSVAPGPDRIQGVAYSASVVVPVHRSETQGLGGVLKEVAGIVKDYIKAEADKLRPPSATDMAEALRTGGELGLPYTPPSESDLIALAASCASAALDTAARFDGTLVLPPFPVAVTSSSPAAARVAADQIVFYVRVLTRLAIWLMHRTGVRV